MKQEGEQKSKMTPRPGVPVDWFVCPGGSPFGWGTDISKNLAISPRLLDQPIICPSERGIIYSNSIVLSPGTCSVRGNSLPSGSDDGVMRVR